MHIKTKDTAIVDTSYFVKFIAAELTKLLVASGRKIEKKGHYPETASVEVVSLTGQNQTCFDLPDFPETQGIKYL